MGLGGIFDEHEVVSVTDEPQGGEVSGVPVKVHRENGFGAWGDGSFDEPGIEVEGGRVDIDEHRSSAGVGDAPAGADPAVGSGDDFVARFDIEGEESHMECSGAVIEPDAVAGAAEFGKGLFEGGDGGAEYELGIANECSEIDLQFVPDGGVLLFQVKEGNRHGMIRRGGGGRTFS